MPRSYDDDPDYQRRPRGDRYDSPDYQSGGSRQPLEYEPAPGSAAGSSRGPGYPPEDHGSRRGDPSYRETTHLEPPQSNAVARRSHQRSRSRSSRSRSRSSSRSSSDRGDRRSRGGSRSRSGRSPSPLDRARSAVEGNFTHSTTGIGASLLGAVVGGFAAKEASQAAMKHRNKGRGGRRGHDEDNKPQLVSTILGAVAGGLGANAIANKVEESKGHDKGRGHSHAWEGRRSRDDDDSYYDGGSRSSHGGGSRSSHDGRGSSRDMRGYDDYDDDGDDRIYDDRRYDDRPRRHRSQEDSRHRS